MSERTELDEFLEDLASEDFMEDTVEAFRKAGIAMIDAGMIYVTDHLESIKSAMRNEYGD